MNLNGPDAAQALQEINAQEGRILAILPLPLKEGEMIFYQHPNGASCCISTNSVPYPSGTGGTTGQAIDEHVEVMLEAGFCAGYEVQDLLEA